MSSIKYEPEKGGMFDKIESKDVAKNAMRITTTIVLALVALNLLLGFAIHNTTLMVGSAILGGIALGLRFTRSRVFAIILCAWCALNTLGGAVLVVENYLAPNTIVPFCINLILLWLSIRCIQAGNALARMKRESNLQPPPLPPPLPQK